MNPRVPLLACIWTLAAFGPGAVALAQTSTQWKVPAETQPLDFRIPDPEREVLFLEDGFAFEIILDFMMIGHPQVRVEAELGEPGEFRIEQANPQALVDVKNVRVEEGQAKAEVEARVTAMSRSDATARARQAIAKIWDPAEKQLAPQVANVSDGEIRRFLLERQIEIPQIEDKKKARTELRRLYLQQRTLQRVLPDFRLALDEFADRKPNWVAPRDRLQWRQTEDHTLVDDYHRLVEYECKDEHLRRCGLGFESNISDFEAKIDGRFDAVYLAMSGKVGEDPEQTRRMVQALGLADLRRLHDSLRVELRCRFYPAADPKDPNAQWFHAQRVACQAKGLASIRVEGRLDPAKKDRVDWWALEDYDEAQVFFAVEQAPGFRVDPPLRSQQGVWLRVIATGDKPVDYALSFRPRKRRDGLNVVIHESPGRADVAFPY